MAIPSVSVLIPVYNGERFLRECLDSVLAQDFRDFEIVAFDDGSKDGSAEILADYARRDARVRWRRNPENLGIGGNWNACLRDARGQLIKFVLHDDKLLHRSTLGRMVEQMNRDAGISLLATGSLRIDPESRPLRRMNAFRSSGVFDGKKIIVRCMEAFGNLIGEPTLTMFRASQASRGFDEGFKQLLDLEMWFHLLEMGRFGYIAEPLCAFREHPDQQTAVNRRSGESHREGLTLSERYCRRPWLRREASPRLIFAQMYYLRKYFGAESAPLVAELAEHFTAWGYRWNWMKFKARRPFENFWRSTTSRIERATLKWSVQKFGGTL